MQDQVITETNRVCNGCQIEQPIENFYKKETGRGGINGRCKACLSKYKRNHKAANQGKYSLACKKYYEANRAKILSKAADVRRKIEKPQTRRQFRASHEYRIGLIGKDSRGKAAALCICRCKRFRFSAIHRVVSLTIKSCGTCRPIWKEPKPKISDHPAYACYWAMWERCMCPNSLDYPDYGGRGIQICKEWRGEGGIQRFFHDMKDRPSMNHSVHRIDNNGNYEPGNCRWATKVEQARKKRNTRLIEFNGKSLCAPEWSEETGLPLTTIYNRVRAGWSAERILTTPRQYRPAG